MTPERWRQIKQILIGWEEQQDLEEYLNACCGDDAALKNEVRVYFEADSDPLEDLGSLVRETVADKDFSFKTQDFLGAGLAGRVFRFRDATRFDGRDVALKRVPKNHLNQKEPAQEWPQTPDLIPLLEVHDTQFELLFFSELAKGPGLDDFCRDHANQIGRLLATFRHICQMVARLHQNKYAPGNIKPGNIRFDHQGRLRLLDVPYALCYQPSPPARRITTDRGPAWQICPSISPEQLQGEAPEPASDVFALGLLFYRIMTGAYPYSLHDVSSEKARRLVLIQTPPAISSFFTQTIASELSMGDRNLMRFLAEGGLDAPIARAVAKNKGDRYPDAGELIHALDQLLPAGQTENTPELLTGNPD